MNLRVSWAMFAHLYGEHLNRWNLMASLINHCCWQSIKSVSWKNLGSLYMVRLTRDQTFWWHRIKWLYFVGYPWTTVTSCQPQILYLGFLRIICYRNINGWENGTLSAFVLIFSTTSNDKILVYCPL